MDSFSLILPVYNEETRIRETLYALDRFFINKQYNYEIIIVNDGSDDNTSFIVNKFKDQNKTNVKLIEYAVNRGKGFAVSCGIENVKKDIVAFMDADLPFKLDLIDSSIELIKNYEADIVLGDRNDTRSSVKIAYSILRKILGKVFSCLIKILLIKGFSDTQCGYKAFRTNIAKKIFSRQTIHGFAFDLELLHIAKKENYKIKKVPVVFSHSKDTKINILWDSIQMFTDLIKIKLNERKGIYDKDYSK